MKKLAFVSALIAALFMAGCSSKSPSTSTTNTDDNSNIESIDVASILSGIQNQLQNVYFDFDKFSIRADQQNAITTNAALFNQNNASAFTILIEGNCDEWGSDEYNYALGVKRAKAAKEALVAQGVNESRISIASNGESKPVCTERSKSCDAQNRRDEFKVMQ
ncbi:Tol-Pal system peptidoglycan-associated lipoprotein [Candidatus Campylobacter infans]|uniref:Peptidoglycan-associated lipoprotein n=1 Tax=Candidatus Campylobacter infans TaxID=2561898 RepID=A0A7H9CKN4_9BACT|nr:OmpA family protein [Candidatus Campylobacter infans]QLI04824.1 Tol-Pal system peptidoglycan-associated lipoprotein [Candidatus Campylobacter infans]